MTTIQFSKSTDTFRVLNEGREAYVPRNRFYDVFTDQDLIDCAQQAIECAGDVITVPSTSNARGLKPRAAQKHFVQ